MHLFYWDLFTNNPQVVHNQVERAVVLALITKKVTKEQNTNLLCYPGIFEIKNVVQGFHNEKSPDLDGVITKGLH